LSDRFARRGTPIAHQFVGVRETNFFALDACGGTRERTIMRPPPTEPAPSPLPPDPAPLPHPDLPGGPSPRPKPPEPVSADPSTAVRNDSPSPDWHPPPGEPIEPGAEHKGACGIMHNERGFAKVLKADSGEVWYWHPAENRWTLSPCAFSSPELASSGLEAAEARCRDRDNSAPRLPTGND
jgi:hypothetical protein